MLDSGRIGTGFFTQYLLHLLLGEKHFSMRIQMCCTILIKESHGVLYD